MNAVYISPHQALGDYLACNGLFREYAKKYSLCIIPVIKKYEREMEIMLGDITNIRMPVYPNRFYASYMEAHRKLLKEKCGFNILNLGFPGEDFLVDPNLKLDGNFYRQAGLDLGLRWSNFSYVRNKSKEQALFNYFKLKNVDYIFIHEDKRRGFLIDRDCIPSNKVIISPNPLLTDFTIFDYRLIIEKASEIHCIESSFSIFIDQLSIDSQLFAHRYSRPEAKNDSRLEFTFKSNWKIIL
jgi:hypothetical protein